MTVLALWATPRTASTAFERMMIERGDHVVLDEPWSRAYYFGPDRRSDRFPLVFPESTYPAVTRAVLELGREHPVFVKDMAYQALPGLDDDAIATVTHTFLIREPEAMLRSLARGWPDATDDETGFAAQAELFDRVVAVTGTVPAVIDSDDLRRDPAEVVTAWCARVGLAGRTDALRWEPGMRSEWQLWRDWYGDVAESSGFTSPTPAADDGEPPELVDRMLPAAVAAYRRLRQHALQPERVPREPS